MREHFKPFDLNLAKQGAPVGARSERISIEILKYTDHVVIGTIAFGASPENAMSWKHDGISNIGDESNLVMLPLGYCEGKPVFSGDHLYDPTGRGFLADVSDTGSYEICMWPKPEPKYPETRMQDYELGLAFKHTMTDEQAQVVRNGANAVIARALNDGDVFTKQQVTAVLEELRNICLRHANPLNIRDIVDGTDWDAILKAGL